MERTIFLIDMDAFFASVEERENPELRGKPVMVVGSPSARSVVCAANYEIRKYGVHSAMGYTKAIRLCPHAVVISAHPTRYRDASHSVFKICEEFTDLLEIASIDECYMDMTPTAERFGGPVEAARRLKERIRETEGLACTVGIGPNKLVAKLAAELRKPDGLFRVTAAEIPRLFASLPISALHGIGGKTAERLRSMGIATAGALGSADRRVLRRAFSSSGDHLADMGRGLDDAPVIPYYIQTPPKSISHEHTLGEDTRDRQLLGRTLHHLAERVAYRLRKAGHTAATVGIVVKFGDMQRITRCHSIPDSTDDGLSIYRTVRPMLDAAMQDPRPIRLIGVYTGNLRSGFIQPGLFDDPRRRRLARVVDSLNERLGNNTIIPASLLGATPRDHITFRG